MTRQPAAVKEQQVKTRPDSRLFGTAVHLLISQLDLSEPLDLQVVEQLKEKLVAEDKITETIADHIDTQSIISFFDSKPGSLAFDKSNKVFREWPFTFAEPQEEDFIIVQGIIDMIIQEPEGLIIIDFKTDRISASQIQERANLYKRQLDLYGQAAESVLKTKVISKWLYFLTPQIGIEV